MFKFCYKINKIFGIADLNPAVSPCGTMIAVASFECKEGGWQGEIEDLMTNIFVFRKEEPLIRQEIVKNGGWPSWGSNNIIYFHRKRPNTINEEGTKVLGDWAVFRADLSCHIFPKIDQITPDNIKAFTPAAIDENTVVVCTIRAALLDSSKVRADIEHYRQIEIFDYEKPKESVLVTRGKNHNADHYNPFVLHQSDGLHIGYHRCVYLLKDDSKPTDTVESHELMNLNSPIPHLELFRVSGVFPTFSKDGKKLAFVDNEFRAVWVADDTSLRIVYEIPVAQLYTSVGTLPHLPEGVKNQVWAPIWSQDPTKDILYFCHGISFSLTDEVDIMAIFNVSTDPSEPFPIVKNCKNNAFPCTNPDGTRLVFRGAELQGPDSKEVPNKYLYIREEADQEICIEHTKVKKLTTKSASYTHCDWSPNGKWIVFSATLDKPNDAPKSDNNLDPGYYAIYLLAVDNSDVMVRVLHSGPNFAGHVNHPFFSPDGNRIVIASDLAAVSCDPISLPIFIHSVRPYGDIFTIKIDSENIENNKDIEKYTRMTHSRYENSTCTWTSYSTKTHPRGWNLILDQPHVLKCPYFDEDGKEGWQMTGHLCIPDRRC